MIVADLLEQKEIVHSQRNREWAGFMVVSAWTQERMLQRQKRRALPLLAAPLVASLTGTLRVEEKIR